VNTGVEKIIDGLHGPKHIGFGAALGCCRTLIKLGYALSQDRMLEMVAAQQETVAEAFSRDIKADCLWYWSGAERAYTMARRQRPRYRRTNKSGGAYYQQRLSQIHPPLASETT
jgi:hypothetical protein